MQHGFYNGRYFVKHHISQIRKKPYQCSHCDKDFSHNCYLKMPLRTHTGEKPYQCSHCKKAFSSKTDHKRHFRTHTGEKPYQCSLCKKTFIHNSNLKNHLKTHTGEKTYQCSHCKKAFAENSTLKSHLRTHTGEKPYQCSHCIKAFAQNSTFKNHLKTHTGEKPYQCSHCKKDFAENSTLKSHLRTHTGEKPYQCSHCKKAFAQNSTLKSHLSTHTWERPYQCSLCDKAFSHNKYLKKHQMTHTGEKLYQCSQCDKAFTEKQGLVKHHNIDITEKTYLCSQCDKVESKKSKSMSDEIKEKIGVKKSNICSKMANKFKKSKIEPNDESDKGALQSNVTKNKNNKSKYEHDETIQTKKSIKFTKNANNLNKSITEKENENEEETQPVFTKNMKLKSESEIEEDNKVKKFNNLTKKSNKLKFLRIESNNEREDEVAPIVFTKNKQSKINADKECSKRIKNASKKTNIKFEISKKEDSKKQAEVEEIIMSDLDDVCDIIKSETFLKEEVDTVQESKSMDDELWVVDKNKQSKSLINVRENFSKRIKEDSKKKILKVEIPKNEDSKKQAVMDEIILSDSDEACDIVKSETFIKEQCDTEHDSKAINDVFWAINKVFDLLEESTEGGWTRTPNKIKQDLYYALQSLKLETFEDILYPNVYNLDVNYRQLYILFSGVDDMILPHALLCKHRYPNCKDIPDKHQEDMNCCI